MNASGKKLQASFPCLRLIAEKADWNISFSKLLSPVWEKTQGSLIPPMPLPSEQTLGCSMWGLRTHSTFPDVRSKYAALTVGSSILSAVRGGSPHCQDSLRRHLDGHQVLFVCFHSPGCCLKTQSVLQNKLRSEVMGLIVNVYLCCKYRCVFMLLCMYTS